MEVTRSNFEELLPQIKDDISKASFITIDGEFTGLNAGQNTNAYDTPAEYYTKLRTGSKNFLLIQLGIGIFRYNETSQAFKQTCYNFYAFPKPHNRQATDRNFLCQSSSIDFLACNNFDFNKLFKEGIPYMTQAEEFKLKEQLEEKQMLRDNSCDSAEAINLVAIPESDQGLIDDICENVKNFLKSDETELIVDRCNGFLRRCVYQTLKMKFDNKVFAETRTLENKSIVIVIQKSLSIEEMEKRKQEQCLKEKSDLETSVGLSKVLRHISNSGKLVIGHNMLLDFLHILHQFFGPLPEVYEDFKEFLFCIFPKVLDTKVMSSLPPFRDIITSNVLRHLLATVSEEPFSIPKIEFDEGYGYSTETVKEHEAGYDAYITGLSFLAMGQYVEALSVETGFKENLEALKPFMNRVFIMKMQDIPFINIAGADKMPSREHVFHITFPKGWKQNDISRVFSPFGSVYISWLNDTTAFVALQKRDQSSIAKRSLPKIKSCTIVPYKLHKSQVNNKATLKKPTIFPGASYGSPVLGSPRGASDKRSIGSGETETDVRRKRRFESETSKVASRSTPDSSNGVATKLTRVSTSPVRTVKHATLSGTFTETDNWD